MVSRRPFSCLVGGDPRTVGLRCVKRCLDQFRQIRLKCSICPRCIGKAHTVVPIFPIYDKNYFSIGAHRGVKYFAPLAYSGGAARCGRARVRAACARQSGLRAVWGVAGGELAAKTRPPGRVPGAAVRLLGARAPAPVGNGGCLPPGADRRPGCARSGGENPKFSPRRWLRSVPRGQPMATWQHGNMATWQHGNMATWQHGNMATWQHGNMATWQHGNMATWQHGNMATWQHGTG